MSQSIVLELQELAADKANDVSDLLRKGLIVATKLGLTDFREWINHELHGYEIAEVADVPRYRKTRAVVRAHNPYRGLIPFHLPVEIADAVCNVEIRQPVGSLVDLEKSEAAELSLPLPPQLEMALMQAQDGFVPMQPVRLIPSTSVAMVIDGVRTTILEWALKLEEEEIVGEGISFSRGEREKAAASTQISIENFQGILGDVSDSQVSQQNQMTVRERDLGSLRQYLSSHGIDDADLDELQEAIESDPPVDDGEEFGSLVNGWIGKMVTKATSGVWNVSIGAAGNILAKAIGMYYGWPG